MSTDLRDEMNLVKIIGILYSKAQTLISTSDKSFLFYNNNRNVFGLWP